MPLPPSDISRKHVHTRTLRVDAFDREDGLMDLEAELVDVKGYDFTRDSGAVHKAGTPVHHMHLRITVDDEYTIKAAEAAYDAAPYNQICASISDAYKDLVGMNLLRRFRHTVKERFGRTAGCTHLTELSYVLPTAAIQARAGRRRTAQSRPSTKRPFELEGCHALRLDSPAVEQFYPKWYVAPATDQLPERAEERRE